MNKRLMHMLWVSLLVAALATTSLLAQAPTTAENAAAAPAAPPATRTDNVKDVLHGVELVDPYRWLEDQWGADTRAWIEAQNKYTDSVVNPLPGRDKLQKRLTELLRVDNIGVPKERKGRYFFSKRGVDQDLFVVYLRQGLEGKDEVLIDPHGLSADHTTSV
ncbi:MAG: prolyl oligopeptidase family serine peptidase, partial [Candidatus Acidiferrales bacterium]